MKLRQIIITTCIITLFRHSRGTEFTPNDSDGIFNLIHKGIETNLDNDDININHGINCMCFEKRKSGTDVSNYLRPEAGELERLVVFFYRNKDTHQTSMYIPNQQKQLVFPEMTKDENDIILLNAANQSVDNMLKHVPLFTISKSPMTYQRDTQLLKNDIFSLPITIKPKLNITDTYPILINENPYYSQEYNNKDNNIADSINFGEIKNDQNKRDSKQKRLENVSANSYLKKYTVQNISEPIEPLQQHYKNLLFEKWFQSQLQRLGSQVSVIFSPADKRIMRYYVNKFLKENRRRNTNMEDFPDMANYILHPVLVEGPDNTRHMKVILISLLHPAKVLGIIPLRKMAFPVNSHSVFTVCNNNRCKLHHPCEYGKCTPVPINLGYDVAKRVNVPLNWSYGNQVMYHSPWQNAARQKLLKIKQTLNNDYPEDEAKKYTLSHIIPISNMVDKNADKYSIFDRNGNVLVLLKPNLNDTIKNDTTIDNEKEQLEPLERLDFAHIGKPFLLGNNKKKSNKKILLSIKTIQNPVSKSENNIPLKTYSKKVSSDNVDLKSTLPLIIKGKLPLLKRLQLAVTNNDNNIEMRRLPVALQNVLLDTVENNNLPKNNRLAEYLFSQRRNDNNYVIKSREMENEIDNGAFPKYLKPILNDANGEDTYETKTKSDFKDVYLDENDDLQFRILGGQAATSSGTPVANKGRSGNPGLPIQLTPHIR